MCLTESFNWKIHFWWGSFKKKNRHIRSFFFVSSFFFVALSNHLPVIVHNSRKHSSRLLMTANLLCNSSGASKNGNIAAPINEYSTTKTHSPGVENKMRSVKCIHRFVWITFTDSSLSTTISPSLVSICDISNSARRRRIWSRPPHTHTQHPATFALISNQNCLK